MMNTKFRRDQVKRRRVAESLFYVRDDTVACQVLTSNRNPLTNYSGSVFSQPPALLHPSKPSYQTSALMDHIETCVDQLLTRG